MTNKQINIAIAEACGWELLEDGSCRTKIHGLNFCAKVADYCNDLNAMHEAEKALDNDFRFSVVLYHQLIPLEDQYEDHTITWLIANRLIKATARQRAEAFLRAIGKWEGAK